jgi:FixJ family two-component response regulator
VAISSRISIIEDDEAMRVALVGLMRSCGFQARDFVSAEDFLATDTSRDVDCIITDVQMPGMSGIDLKATLSARHCRVPVIMITARTDPGLEERVLASGAVCLLRKPFAPRTLIDCVTRVLKS